MELLIVAAIVSVVSLQLASLFVKQSQTNRSIVQTSDFNGFIQALQMSLQFTACPTALQDTGNLPVRFNTTDVTGNVNVSIDHVTVGPVELAKVGKGVGDFQITSLAASVIADLDSPAQQRNLLIQIKVNATKKYGADPNHAVGGDTLSHEILIGAVAASPGSTSSLLTSCSTVANPPLPPVTIPGGTCAAGSVVTAITPLGAAVCNPVPPPPGAPTPAEIKCLGQGGGLNAPFPLLTAAAQCASSGQGACNRVPSCTLGGSWIFAAGGYVDCTWTCTPT